MKASVSQETPSEMGWTIWDFLLMNAPQFHHKINEKDLLKGLQEYAGELYCVPRGLAQQLKVILKKEKMVKNILERPKHAAFLWRNGRRNSKRSLWTWKWSKNYQFFYTSPKWSSPDKMGWIRALHSLFIALYLLKLHLDQYCLKYWDIVYLIRSHIEWYRICYGVIMKYYEFATES